MTYVLAAASANAHIAERNVKMSLSSRSHGDTVVNISCCKMI